MAKVGGINKEEWRLYMSADGIMACQARPLIDRAGRRSELLGLEAEMAILSRKTYLGIALAQATAN